MAERARIAVTGVVQGVGFRPFVFMLAGQLGLRGFVSNTASGVLIEAEGERVQEFLERLPREAPPLARISGLSVTRLPIQGFPSFTIRDSHDLPGAFTLVSPDMTVCDDCLRELQDPADRRYQYPFLNCTHCGPRYSIIRAVPYDRSNTTMAAFRLCPECDREYHDPKDRRFHAQPNACPKCGPKCDFKMQNARFQMEEENPVAAAIEMLRRGGIVAIKGLGGFHIACDATNEQAVQILRERKRRSNKPFAIMAPSVDAIARFCEVSDQERSLLESRQRPIVLLMKKQEPSVGLSKAVSPNNGSVGCMLPYTPLHYLLFRYQVEKEPRRANYPALVMTSGNLSEEPIVHDNRDAERKLSCLVDGFLFHDRDIFMRVDDSVIRTASDGRRATGDGGEESAAETCSPLFIRRSRGYAPEPIALQRGGPEVLGCGADLKNTFTLTKGAWAIPSQHVGDMENYETLRFFEETLANLKQVYRVEPVAIAHDLHPGYLSTKWAIEQCTMTQKELYAIQHHYAHIGSVMAEEGITGKVIGIAFDGTGYGADGNLWGGEFLVADIDGFERLGQLKYLPLPGGEAAIREPWRTAVSLVREAAGDASWGRLEEIGFVERQGSTSVHQVLQIAASSELSPLASGAGRYFDAVAALVGLCDRNTFEGEAAIALESLVVNGVDEDYPVDYNDRNGYTDVDCAPLVRAVLADLASGQNERIVATKFHNSFAAIIATMAGRISERTGIRDVALSGGTFQNRYLLERATLLLRKQGLQVHRNTQMPPNDACISLGQAYIVRERMKGRMGRAPLPTEEPR